MRGLTDKQKLFCKFYTDNLNEKTYQNGTQSAIAAGYTKNAAAPTASRLLTQVNIIEYMSRLKKSMEELFAESAHDMMEVLREIATDSKYPTAPRVAAAKDLLDRAGYVATKKIEGKLIHAGNVTTTNSKEVHIIQQIVNENEDVADAILKAMKDRNQAVVIPEEVKSE